ncbi:MAG: radical SAM protein [bacterium]|nr:radical SAM protein [bacterium]
MISYLIEKKWRYLAPIAAIIPEGLLRFAAKIFVKIQKQELMGKKIPKRAIFFITNKCNLRCKHCFYIPNVVSAQEISFEQIQKLARSAKGSLKQITLTGGEPFLRNDLEDIIFAFAENGCEIVNIDTNGILIERIESFLKNTLAKTQIKFIFILSLDGPSSVHDSIRGMPGSFEKTLKTLTLLSEYKQKYPKRFINIFVSTSINRLNAAYLPETISRIGSLKNIGHEFNFTRSTVLHTFGVPKDRLSGFDVNQDIVLNIDEMKKVFAYLDKEAWGEKNKTLTALINRQRMIEAIKILEKRGGDLACPAGKTELVVYPEGDVGICEMLKPLGNLKETDYDLIKFYGKYRQQFQAKKSCSCTHDCNVLSSMRLSPQSLVEIVKRKKAW